MPDFQIYWSVFSFSLKQISDSAKSRQLMAEPVLVLENLFWCKKFWIWNDTTTSKIMRNMILPAFFIRHFEKNSRTKKLKTQGKNSITQGKNSRFWQSSQICGTKKGLYYYFSQISIQKWTFWKIQEKMVKIYMLIAKFLENLKP